MQQFSSSPLSCNNVETSQKMRFQLIPIDTESKTLPASLSAIRWKACERNIEGWNRVSDAVWDSSHSVLLVRSPGFWAAHRDRWRRWCGSAWGHPSRPLSLPSFALARRTLGSSAAHPEPHIRPPCTITRGREKSRNHHRGLKTCSQKLDFQFTP